LIVVSSEPLISVSQCTSSHPVHTTTTMAFEGALACARVCVPALLLTAGD
jgi:hypothetical protein